ncbi:MAG: sulfide/dihydroorotate dehydrogenase-like FAD/NAD-binding protein [Nitrospirae bacterium]|nr:sulfide/dihydroorotate dehydrogenase-like FAD/NAD-binding protein [Nitrospirota bacterium]
MFRIIKKESVAMHVEEMVIHAPHIAGSAQAGNFIILRIHDTGERIPLTIADSDCDAGTITILFQKAGKTTEELASLKEGDSIRDIAGPLGHPTPLKRCGRAVLVGGGIGSATLFPILKALKKKRNRVTVILGARTSDLLVWEHKFGEIADKMWLVTDDGTSGKKGFVTDALNEVVENEKVDIVIAVGPIRMMQAVAELTRFHDIPAIVSLNPIMVEGTGMCGACRVSVGGKTKFACVDGPEFDAHEVDFEEIARRLAFYKREEMESLHKYRTSCKGRCRGK